MRSVPLRPVLGCVVVASLLLAFSPARAAWRVWTERSTVKVLPDRAAPDATPPDAAPAAEPAVHAVRGEWEGVQLVVRGDAALAGVDVAVEDLAGPASAVIPVPRTHVYREWLLTLEHFSECFPRFDCSGYPPALAREPGRYPDPLIPFADPYDDDHAAVGAPFDVPADESHAVYVDVFVPRDAVPGTYTATWTVTAAGETPVPIPVTFVIHDVELPAERRVATAYGFGADRIWRHHGGVDGPSEEDRVRIQQNYEWALREHRMDLTTISGPLPTFEFDADGLLIPPDWTAYDDAVASRLDGDWWPDGRPPVRFNTGKFRPGSGQGDMTEDQWAQASAAFAEHLRERGWLERAYVYSSDEPFLPGHQDAYETIPRDVSLLRRHTDLWNGHVMVTNPFDERLAGSIDIWCPVTPMYDDWYWADGHAGRAGYDERRALGEVLWFYNCNANFPPWAGYDIDAKLGHEPRILKWGAYAEKAEGFLHWRANYWYTNDPWHDVANVDGFGPLFARNGDGLLLYPGDHDGSAGGLGSPESVAIAGPVVSYRMKILRDGLEDWELFLVAEDAGAEDYVRSEVARAYRQFGAHIETGDYDPDNPPWTHDPALLDEIRANVVAKILYLRDPDTYPDPEQPPAPEPGPEPGADVAEPSGPDTPDAGGAVDVVSAPDGHADADTGGAPLSDSGGTPPLSDSGGTTDDVGGNPDVAAPTGDGGSGGCAVGSAVGGAFPAILGLLLFALVALLRTSRRRSAGTGVLPG